MFHHDSPTHPVQFSTAGLTRLDVHADPPPPAADEVPAAVVARWGEIDAPIRTRIPTVHVQHGAHAWSEGGAFCYRAYSLPERPELDGVVAQIALRPHAAEWSLTIDVTDEESARAHHAASWSFSSPEEAWNWLLTAGWDKAIGPVAARVAAVLGDSSREALAD